MVNDPRKTRGSGKSCCADLFGELVPTSTKIFDKLLLRTWAQIPHLDHRALFNHSPYSADRFFWCNSCSHQYSVWRLRFRNPNIFNLHHIGTHPVFPSPYPLPVHHDLTKTSSDHQTNPPQSFPGVYQWTRKFNGETKKVVFIHAKSKDSSIQGVPSLSTGRPTIERAFPLWRLCACGHSKHRGA